MKIDIVNIDDFGRKQDRLMLWPRLVLAMSGIFAVLVVMMVARALVFSLGLYTALAALESYDGHNNGASRDVLIFSTLILSAATLFYVGIYLSLRSYYNAFYKMSSIRLLFPFFVVAAIDVAAITFFNVNIVSDVLSNSGNAVIFMFFIVSMIGLFVCTRLFMQDPVSLPIRRARTGGARSYFRRYGSASKLAVSWNYLKFAARLGAVLLIMLLGLGFYLALQFGEALLTGGQLAVMLIPVLIALVVYLRPFVSNGIFRAERNFRRDSARSAAELFDADKRPPVIFLRSFQDDAIEVERVRSVDEAIYGLHKHYVRLEELLVDRAFGYGPVGALHDQREAVQPLGAARDLTTHEDWQEHVNLWLHKAQRIVFVIGRTNGLNWEIKKAVELGIFQRMIVVVPPNWRYEAENSDVATIIAEKLSISAVQLEKCLLIYFRDDENAVFVMCGQKESSCYENAIALAFEDGLVSTASTRLVSVK